MGNSGIGTSAHIAMELLRMSAGIQYVHVPYKGIPPAMIDLLNGTTQRRPTSPTRG